MRGSHLALAIGSAVAVAAIAVVAAGAAAGLRSSSGPDGSVSSPPMSPDPTPAPADAFMGLANSRRDLAKRVLSSTKPEDVLRVHLREVRHAGWDGCLGIVRPNQACTAIFTGGLVALFDLDGKSYRYHIAGGQVIATDFLDGKYTVSDGSPPTGPVRTDAVAQLAQYAREDLAFRAGTPVDQVTVVSIIPSAGEADDALVTLRAAVGGETVYHVGLAGVKQLDKSGASSPVHDAAVLQQRMRDDLAARLGVPVGQVSVASYREVTWPDGCIGVHKPGSVCTAVMTPGFAASLTAPDASGNRLVYRYHGAGDAFTAVTFLQGVTVDMP